MKRSLVFLLPLALLAPACKTAGPQVPAGTTTSANPLRAYVDQSRILRHKGDKTRIRLDARARPTDGCAGAVRVRAAAFEKGAVRFALETLGRPRLADRRADCRRMQPEIELVISGIPATAPTAELMARIDAVLLTAEAYLASRGVRFELPPGELPAEIASRETFATGTESRLGQSVTAWPTPLLVVDPWYHDPSGRVRHEGEVEAEAVVGSDGRLHRPHVRTGLSDAHESAVLRVLPLWRFTPARRASSPLAAHIALQPVLHIY